MVPKILLGLYMALFIALGVAPYDRAVWVAENLPIVAIVLLLAVTWRNQRFSSLAYVLMSCLIILHTIGGHFTFERVPFGFVSDLFGFERNHFDRVAHFSVGFYGFPIAEWLRARRLVANRFLLFTYPVFAIMAIAATYEVVEWIYAALSDPAAGAAYLGSQGDPWDAQRDMLADTLGALVATTIFFVISGTVLRDDRDPSSGA